jgi:hypothetical protein
MWHAPSRGGGRLEPGRTRYRGGMGLIELLLIVLVLAAIFGGIAVNPLLFVLLLAVVVILFMRGGFGSSRAGRI